ncbi:hypothetical protein PJN93_32625, partial [Mycobacterium kansasii]
SARNRRAGLSVTGFVGLVVAVLVLSLCAADFPPYAKPEPPSGRMELAQGWQLASARTVTADGAAMSTPGEVKADWHPV